MDPTFEIKHASTDAVELLRRSFIERPPRFEELPKQVRIDGRVPLMPGIEHEGTDQEGGAEQSIFALNRRIQGLTEGYGWEFGCALVADHDGNLSVGPLCEGDEESVRVDAPLQERQFVSKSGLIVYQADRIVATLHSHPGSPVSFSLVDIYHHFREGGTEQQAYVVRSDGVIDMIQVTQSTSFVTETAFRRLSELWSTYLTENGELRRDISEESRTDFLRRISREILMLGYYSNQNSGDPSILSLVE
jgi:proteasome lid subunit RPN8/RPN11